jgi:hypothetical protein
MGRGLSPIARRQPPVLPPLVIGPSIGRTAIERCCDRCDNKYAARCYSTFPPNHLNYQAYAAYHQALCAQPEAQPEAQPNPVRLDA